MVVQRDIKIREGSGNELLESVVPVDRVVTIDAGNMVSLSDCQFWIPEEMIEFVINTVEV